MKTTIISSLKKRVLLVTETDSDWNNIILKGNWTYLNKLKHFTDSDCEGLVEKSFGLYADYKNIKGFLGSKKYQFKSAKESFLSALESEEVQFKNRFGELYNMVDSYMQPKEMDKVYEKWKEAEQNVFSLETLIFVEL